MSPLPSNCPRITCSQYFVFKLSYLSRVKFSDMSGWCLGSVPWMDPGLWLVTRVRILLLIGQQLVSGLPNMTWRYDCHSCRHHPQLRGGGELLQCYRHEVRIRHQAGGWEHQEECGQADLRGEMQHWVCGGVHQALQQLIQLYIYLSRAKIYIWHFVYCMHCWYVTESELPLNSNLFPVPNSLTLCRLCTSNFSQIQIYQPATPCFPP